MNLVKLECGMHGVLVMWTICAVTTSGNGFVMGMTEKVDFGSVLYTHTDDSSLHLL